MRKPKKNLSYWQRHSNLEKLFHLLLLFLIFSPVIFLLQVFLRKNSVHDVSIEADSSLLSLKSMVDANKLVIKNQLPQSISPKLYQKILPNLNIKIIPRMEVDRPNNEGDFLSASNTILLPMHPDPNPQQVLGVLRNQMHAAANCATHPELGLKRCGLPFVEDKQFDRLLSAIQIADKKIDDFKALYFNDKNDSKLNSYFKILKDYQPIIYQQDLSASNFHSKVRNHFFQKSYLPNVQYVNQPDDWQNATIYIHQVFDYRGTKILRYSYAKDDSLAEKITAFLMDDYLQRKMAQSKRDPEIQLAHRARHIAEFSDAIHCTFFKGWRNYFVRYHDDEDHCAVLQLK